MENKVDTYSLLRGFRNSVSMRDIVAALGFACLLVYTQSVSLSDVSFSFTENFLSYLLHSFSVLFSLVMMAIVSYTGKLSCTRDIFVGGFVALVGSTLLLPIVSHNAIGLGILSVISGISLGLLLFVWFNFFSSRAISELVRILLISGVLLLPLAAFMWVGNATLALIGLLGMLGVSGFAFLYTDPHITTSTSDGELTRTHLVNIPFFGLSIFVLADILAMVLFGVAQTSVFRDIQEVPYFLTGIVFFALIALSFFIVAKKELWFDSVWIPSFFFVLTSLVFACFSDERAHLILFALLFGTASALIFLRWLILPAYLSYFQNTFNTPRIFLGAFLLLITNSFLFSNLGNAIGMLLPSHAEHLGNIAGIMAVILVLVFSGALIVSFKQGAQVLPASKSADEAESKQDTPVGVQDETSAFETLCAQFNLTAREMEVALLTAQGFASAYIANDLVISSSTVRFHQQNIYRKMGIHSRQELISLYRTGKM